MDESKYDYTTIDEYIRTFDGDTQKRLFELKNLIKDAAPNASEKISWAMPTFYLYGNLVHFASHKKHTGFYPGADAISHFSPELTEYKTSKGAVQFPLCKPLPKELITKIVKFAVEQNIKDYRQKQNRPAGK